MKNVFPHMVDVWGGSFVLSLIQLMDLRSLLKCSSSIANVYVYKRNLHSHEQICEIIPKVALGFKHLMFFVLEHVAHVRLYALATNSPHGAVPNYLNKAENTENSEKK